MIAACRSLRRALPLAVLSLAPMGCAATAGGTAGVAALPADQVVQVAQALADADLAATAGERDRLTLAVRIVDAAGARPLPEFEHDPLPGWRSLAADAGPPMRGNPLGPGYRKGRLDAGQTTRIEQLFLSGERAKIAVSTPDGSALELRVRDAREGRVCERREPLSSCQWVPIFTQRYSIEIANRGAGPARYYLVIE